jgi:hypothetical protein
MAEMQLYGGGTDSDEDRSGLSTGHPSHRKR